MKNKTKALDPEELSTDPLQEVAKLPGLLSTTLSLPTHPRDPSVPLSSPSKLWHLNN